MTYPDVDKRQKISWASGQPDDLPGQQCSKYDVKEELFYSTECADKTACFKCEINSGSIFYLRGPIPSNPTHYPWNQFDSQYILQNPMTSSPSTVMTFRGLGGTSTIIQWDWMSFSAIFTNDKVTTEMDINNGNLTLKPKTFEFKNPYIQLTGKDKGRLLNSIKAKLTQVADFQYFLKTY